MAKCSIKIESGKNGFFLRIGDKYIYTRGDGYQVWAIRTSFIGSPPAMSSEWMSVRMLRKFWSRNRVTILKSLETPYLSVNGSLVLEKKPTDLEKKVHDWLIKDFLDTKPLDRDAIKSLHIKGIRSLLEFMREGITVVVYYGTGDSGEQLRFVKVDGIPYLF